MTRPFLFGGSSSSQSQNKYLVEFRAGKMTMKNMLVSADKRKGLVYVYQADDSLMHFCWKDRTSGVVEDDLIIFPDDVIFKKVPECTTGRVFVLKFKSSSRRCFYWLQEPKTDRDNEFCCKVNQYLNNPPTGGSRSGTSGSLGGSSTPSQSGGGLQSELSSLGDGDLQNLLNNMSQQQLLQLLGGVGGINQMPSLSSLLSGSRPSSGQSATTSSSGLSSSESSHNVTETAPTASARTTQSTVATTQSPAASTTSSATASSTSIQLSDLQNILSGINMPATGTTEAAAAKPSVDLSSAITAEALQPLFNNQELMDRVRSLLPPSSDVSAPVPSDQLRSTVQSPQFQQALGMFSAALSSGQLGPLMAQFGMTNEVVAAANSGDMDAFVKALQSSKNKPPGNVGDKKDQDKDEDMALD